MESLYRKYRPQTFADVVGQAHVVGTLQRAVLEGRTSHAYLFCGPRGTGKTTMARLLAKALMCEQGQGHLPDGTCEQCRLIAAGEHPDVFELDAASRTGVDNVREEIINSVGFAPVMAQYKLYIIDEVHMLTTAAFNALLKTLEEPPDHVIFVLCTTDPQKIPQTILSRVQRFDFRSISNEDIEQRLVYVCDQEGFTYEDEALRLVVTNARGGMRDALSTLEQLSVFGSGTISADSARDLLGALPGQELDQVVSALATRDVAALFQLVDTLSNEGRDLLQFVRELAVRIRDIYVAQVVGDKAQRALGPAADVARLMRDASAFGSAERLARILTLLGDVSREMGVAPNQRLVLEICFTRIARPDTDLTLESLAERVAELEVRLKALESNPPQASVAERPAPREAQAAGDVGRPMPPVEHTSHAQADAGRVDADARVAQPQEQAQPPATRPQVEVPVRQQGTPTPGPVASPPRQPVRTAMPAAKERREKSSSDRPRQQGPSVEDTPKTGAAGSAAVTDAGALQRMWKQVVSAMVDRNPARGSLITSSHAISDDGQRLTVSLPKGSGFALKMLERNDVRKILDACVSEVFGTREVRFLDGQMAATVPGGAAHRSDRRPTQAAKSQQPTRQMQSQPSPTYRAPAPAAPERSQSAYPMPWDAPQRESAPQPAAPPTMAPEVYESVPEDVYAEQVPYEELEGYSFDEYGAESFPEDGFVAPQVTPAPVSPLPKAPVGTVRQESAAPDGKGASEPDGAEETKPVSTPVAQTSAPVAPKAALGAEQDAGEREEEKAQDAIERYADELPAELLAILENVFEVFGNDVKVKRER